MEFGAWGRMDGWRGDEMMVVGWMDRGCVYGDEVATGGKCRKKKIDGRWRTFNAHCWVTRDPTDVVRGIRDL